MKAFETYAALVRENLTDTQLAGRYEAQSAAERLIFADIATKLRLSPTDKLLDIGCGPGKLLNSRVIHVRKRHGNRQRRRHRTARAKSP